MIVYRHKFFDALDDEERKMYEEEREEREKLEKERKKNIENRTKYNTFLSNYRTPGTSWGRDEAKKKAKELDKLGYSDEDILLRSSSVFPLISDDTVRTGVKIGGISGQTIGSAMLLSKKFRDKHKSTVNYFKYPLGMAGIGGIVGGTIGAIGATKKRKEAVNDLLEQRRKDEEERRKK
jgi:hypothetical protein